MQIFFPKENEFESRVSILPETVIKLVELGMDVEVEASIGKTLHISDDLYTSFGASIIKDRDSSLSSSDVICRINKPEKEEISLIKKNSIHISFLDPFNEIELVEEFARSNISAISMELIPRITRAQKMDALSSQANLGGYAAVIEASSCLSKSFPMMMTAAGTISPSKVFVIGVGVAGLQAIATAKRMGAIVFATDVRMASKEQVESLGGKFLTVEGVENLETEGGYAKEASDEFKIKQEKLKKIIVKRSKEKKLSEKQKLAKELDDIILNNINQKVATMLHSNKSYSGYLKKVQDRKIDPFEAADKISNSIMK